MAAGKVVDADNEPLLVRGESGGRVVVAAEEAGLLGGQPVATQRWEGGLLQCCGSCDLVGWGSCLLSRYLPCVAFGSNSRRGFRRSAWLQGLAFLALFGLAYWAFFVGLAAASHNLLANCNGPLPHPPHHHSPLQGHPDFLPQPSFQALHDQAAQQQNDVMDSLLVDLFPGAASQDWGDESYDEDWRDETHGKDKGGRKVKKPCNKARKILPGQPTPLDVPEKPATSFQSVGSFVGREEQPRQAWQPRFSDNQDDLYASPECQQALGIYIGAWALVIVTLLVAVHFAARRRTQLRQRFGIAGSKLGDFCTWCWCGSCALCQETRTLWANNVHEGVWHGRVQYTGLPVPTVPAHAPPAQFMSSEAPARA